MKETRICSASGERFTIESEEFELYRRLGAPLPTLAPAERQRRRTSYRNFINLYYRPCSATGQRILSMYDTDAPFPVYSNAYWWSDKWDARSFGRSYDLNRPFFEQFRELNNSVPRFSVTTMQCENSDFANMTMYSRNCYMTFGCINSEDCMFGHIIWECKNCVDCLYGYQCQWCSNSIDVVGCYDVHYSTEVVNCSECYFLHDCRNCQNCFGCYNLRSKQYCIFNRQLSRIEYERELAKLLPLTAETVEQCSSWLDQERKNHACFPGTFTTQCEEAEGNHLYHSAQLKDCFDAKRCEESRHCYTVEQMYRCSDISFSGGGLNKFCLDCLTITRCEEVLYSHYMIDCSNSALSQFCLSANNLFGCIGIRNGAHCILNKQYSPADYTALRAKIIEQMMHDNEWGEFFPAADSPFAYNESIAADYQPLSRNLALQRGLRWKDSLEQQPKSGANLKSPEEIPARFDQVDSTILEQTFRCSETGKAFKFIRPEIEFYFRSRLPLPRSSFVARHRKRMALRGPRTLHNCRCPQCSKPFASASGSQTAVAENVLCSRCYQAAIEGEAGLHKANAQD